MLSWQRAFVLHRRAYQETSLLIDLFTEKAGRVALIAKGARRKNSMQKSTLQAFTPLLVEYRGHGQVKTLCRAEAFALALPITGKALYSALYINELLTRVFRVGVAPGNLFTAYIYCLQQLAKELVPIEYALRLFEFDLLDNLGYRIDRNSCDNLGIPLTAEKSYFYAPEVGFMVTEEPTKHSFTGHELLAFASRDLTTAALQCAAKRFTRHAFKPYVGEKPFKSREFFLSSITHHPAHPGNH